MPRAGSDPGVYRRHIPLRLGGAVETPKHAHQKIRLQTRLRPIHPTLCERPFARIVRPESAVPVFRRQITQDRLRFPDNGATVVDHRHPSVRIHRQKLGCIVEAEIAASGNMLVGQPQLPDQPHDFLEIE